MYHGTADGYAAVITPLPRGYRLSVYEGTTLVGGVRIAREQYPDPASAILRATHLCGPLAWEEGIS